MQVSWRQERPGAPIEFTVGADTGEEYRLAHDFQGRRWLRMFRPGGFMVESPDGFDAGTIHPDLVGAAMILILDPFTVERIELERPVSRALADGYFAATGKRIGPVDNTIEPRRASPTAAPALSYSGGYDSVAALSLMPPGTTLMHFERTPGLTRSQSNSKAALESLAEAGRRYGFRTVSIESDFARLAEPVGAVHGLFTGVPAILYADHYDLDGIGFGHLLDSYYGLLDGRFEDDPAYPGFRDLDPVLAAVDMPVLGITGGLTEVGTAIVAQRAGDIDIAQGCIRGGSLGETCMNCPKCFRKIPLSRLVAGEEVEAELVDQLFAGAGVDRELAVYPNDLEITYMWVSRQLAGKHRWMRLLARMTGATRRNTDWATRNFTPALELVPEKYREGVAQRLAKVIDPMSPADERRARRWNVHRRSRLARLAPARHRFWREYSRAFDRPRLKPGNRVVLLQVGQRERIGLAERTGFGRGRNVARDAKWRSRNREVVKAGPGGVVRGRSPGVTMVVASYRGSKFGVEVAVVPAIGDGCSQTT